MENIEFEVGKGKFFKTLSYYFAKEWKLSLSMLFLCLMFVVLHLSLPILTYQMTLAITSEKNDSKESVKNIITDLWTNDWELLIYISVGIVILYTFFCLWLFSIHYGS
ncbi:hypothetical protein [Spiroplasma endosymbiont of Atherix ibis]|uniref:hypothetical protein n=1 Tax=Spiroplasma endosymbiont of Atherix ibis TaxID=3066291 RepID=UPI0030D52D22